MRKLLIGLGMVAGVAVIAVLLLSLPGLSGDASPTVFADGETAVVQRITLNHTVDSTGQVSPESSLTLAFGVGGPVNAVNVDVADTVTSGQVLAELDTTDLDYQLTNAELSLSIQQANYDKLVATPTAREVAQAEASLAQAQSQLEAAQQSQSNVDDQITQSCSGLNNAQRNLEDAQDAYDTYLTAGYEADPMFAPDPDAQESKALDSAQSSYDSALAQCNIATTNSLDSDPLASAEASLTQAQASLDELMAGPTAEELAIAEAQLEQSRIQLAQRQADLQDAVLIAPFDGIITDVYITEGQTASTNNNAIALADTSTLHLDVAIDELDIAQIETGQDAIITLEALDDAPLHGTVTRIAPTGDSSQGLVTYSVRIDITDTSVISPQSATSAQPTASSGGMTRGANTAGPAQNGDMAYLREIMPLLINLGGPQTLATEEGVQALDAALADADLSDETRAAIAELGGAAGLAETLAAFQPGAGIGQAGAGPNQQNEAAPDAQPATDAQDVPATDQTVSVSNLPIRIGMTAEVEIIVQVEADVLAVPTEAIQRNGSREFVTIQDANGATMQIPITSGDSQNGLTVVYGDLVEGQLVVIPTQNSSSSSSDNGGGFGLPGVGFPPGGGRG